MGHNNAILIIDDDLRFRIVIKEIAWSKYPELEILEADTVKGAIHEAKHRQPDYNIPDIVFIECCCREPVIRQRLRNLSKSHAISDARLKHLEEFKSRYEALDEIPTGVKITVDTKKPLAGIIEKILPRADMPEPARM